jgi:diadenosine tetraphosphate (Ap4A) HIT family hydrolase
VVDSKITNVVKKVSSKQQKINKELKKVYQEIATERGHYCTGCGRSDVPLSHSHIIPRSRRKDLITDKNNITYHCLSMGDRKGCHDIWDSTDRHTLLDYHKNMEYILENDTEYYFLISD